MIFTERPADFKPWFEVAACLCEWQGKFLLLKRLEGKSEGGKWGAVGGKIDASETVLQALTREVKEEAGINLREKQIQSAQTFLVRAGEKDFVYHLHRAVFDQLPEITLNPNEHTQFQWVSLEESLALPLVNDMEECLRTVYQK